jgi:hypothetical protein
LAVGEDLTLGIAAVTARSRACRGDDEGKSFPSSVGLGSSGPAIERHPQLRGRLYRSGRGRRSGTCGGPLTAGRSGRSTWCR